MCYNVVLVSATQHSKSVATMYVYPLPLHSPGCNLKNDRMISVRFQGKSFNITVIQVYAPNSNAEEGEIERFLKTYTTF